MGRRKAGDPYLTDWTMTRYSDPTTVISSGLTLSDPISQVHKIRVTEPEEPEQMLTLFLPIVIR